MDRLLQRAVSTGVRRGFSGEPEWLAVAALAVIARRSIRLRPRGGLVWRGTLAAGEELVLKMAPRRGSKAPSGI